MIKRLKRKIIRSLTRTIHRDKLRACYRLYSYGLHWIKYGDPFFPRIISIEINTHCNRACVYCPNVFTPKAPRLIKQDVFDKIVQRIAELNYSGVVYFVFFNEPTLNPKLKDYIAQLKQHAPKVMTRICTNGDLLTAYTVKQMIESGLDRIYVMRHIPTSNQWSEKMQSLAEAFPGIFVIMDIEDLEKTNGLNDFGGTVNVKNKMIPEKNRHGVPVCRVHAHVAQITIDGKWDLCCTDYGRTHSFGDLMHDSFSSIWKDRSFVVMRNKLRSGQPVLPFCKSCFCFTKCK
jgi:MoaA/NifB/PqqE/SkfB family radical SAM enzyme